jgi:hypothetical protein
MNKERPRPFLLRLCRRNSHSLQHQPARELPLANGRKGSNLRLPGMGRRTLQSDAHRCKPLQVVAGGRFELYSVYPLRIPAVSASVGATK